MSTRPPRPNKSARSAIISSTSDLRRGILILWQALGAGYPKILTLQQYNKACIFGSSNRIFRAHSRDVIGRFHRPARYPRDQFLGRKPFALRIHLLGKPSQNRLELPSRHPSVGVRNVLQKGVPNLPTDHVAHRVSWKITDRAARPMN